MPSSRTILRLSGPDTRDFLQGLITNDIAKLSDGLVYAAILTPQGKYLADFFLATEGDEVLLDVATALADMLTKRLTMYKLRAKVTIEPSGLNLQRGTGDTPDGAFADPRHPMKHKTELRKGFMSVTVKDGPVPVGTDVMAGDKVAGQLFTQAQGGGIAYLRLDRAKGSLTAGDATILL